MDSIATLPLLQLLATIPTQTLSRGDALRAGMSDTMICEAQRLDQIFVTSIDNTRNAEVSSLASLTLTDKGEQILDDMDESL